MYVFTKKKMGFTLIEIIATLFLLGILAIFGTKILKTAISGYVQTRGADGLVQQAQMALQRMTIEFSYIKAAGTTGTGTSLNYNGGNIIGQHLISVSGSNLYYSQNGTNYVLADGLAPNGLQFTYYTTYNSAASSSFSNATTLIGINLTMLVKDSMSNATKTFSTRVSINKFE